MSAELAALALVVHIIVVPILMVIGCREIDKVIEEESIELEAKKRILQEDAEYLNDAMFWEEIDEE